MQSYEQEFKPGFYNDMFMFSLVSLSITSEFVIWYKGDTWKLPMYRQ